MPQDTNLTLLKKRLSLKKVVLLSFITGLLLVKAPATTHSATNPLGSGDITNSATIEAPIITSIEAPQLITPVDDSLTNNPYETFSWYQSTPVGSISHYTLYLDDTIVADNVPHVGNADTSLFASTLNDDIISLVLKTPLSDGTHTFKVVAHSFTSATATSDTRTFYVDTTVPIIILQAVDQNTMYWATNDPFTIPSYDERHLTVTTKNPLLSGKIESSSNFKLSLVCPLDAPSTCLSQTITINDPDGNWKHRFRKLIEYVVYQAYLTSTDAGGNSNIFPEFTVQYTPTPLIPLLSIPRPTPTPLPSLAPKKPSPADPRDLTEFKKPPPAPPSPFKKVDKDQPPTPTSPYLNTFFLLSLFGLLIHLSMTTFAVDSPLKLIPKLLFTLFNPIKKRLFEIVTPPLTLISYHHQDGGKILHQTFVNLLGQNTLPDIDLPVFIKTSFPGYEPHTIIRNPSKGPFQPLILNPKPSLTLLERLQKFSLATRSLPLGLSLISSIIHLFILPTPTALVLFIAGSDLLYNQYVSPKLQGES
jgi:hypothetical protein